MLTSSLKIVDKYDYLEEKFKKGYEFLRNTDLSALPLGRMEIDGDEIFANVQEYTTLAIENCKFEAHDRYFDIQYVVEGEEQFGYAKRDDLEAATAYDGDKDIIFFKAPAACGTVLLKAGDCAVVAPEDAHRPKGAAGAPGKVRKVILKIKV